MNTAVAIPPPFPLSWPPAKPRTPAHNRLRPRYSGYDLASASAAMHTEIGRWQRLGREERIVEWELTCNHLGRPTKELSDPGAALWFTLGTGYAITGAASLMAMACDKFRDLPQNIRALSLTLERLRLVADVGAYSLIQAVEGAKMLPPPEQPVDWRDVLQLGANATLAAANAMYRALARDAAGDDDALRRLNAAIEAARKEWRQ